MPRVVRGLRTVGAHLCGGAGDRSVFAIGWPSSSLVFTEPLAASVLALCWPGGASFSLVRAVSAALRAAAVHDSDFSAG